MRKKSNLYLVEFEGYESKCSRSIFILTSNMIVNTNVSQEKPFVMRKREIFYTFFFLFPINRYRKGLFKEKVCLIFQIQRFIKFLAARRGFSYLIQRFHNSNKAREFFFFIFYFEKLFRNCLLCLRALNAMVFEGEKYAVRVNVAAF